MRLFIDTANVEEIAQAKEWGLLDGVTTNPSLIRKEVESRKGIDMDSYIRRILETAGAGRDVSLEVLGGDADALYEQGLLLYTRFNEVAGNVVIKIPVNPAVVSCSSLRNHGIEATRRLSGQKILGRSGGIPVNVTLVFTPEQAYLAARAGAKYVSPFAGRVDDFLRKQVSMDFGKDDYFPAEGIHLDTGRLHDGGIVSGVDLVARIVRMFGKDMPNTFVLAASLRNIRQVREVAAVGADYATVPFSVLREMYATLDHPKTLEGMRNFTNDVVPEYRALFE